MNFVQKCNCCVCEDVCKYKAVYQNGIKNIMDAVVSNDSTGGFWLLRDCPHIEVSIRCPHMVVRSQTKEAKEDATD